MQALDPLDQWEVRGCISASRTGVICYSVDPAEQTPHFCEQAVVEALAAASAGFWDWVLDTSTATTLRSATE